MMFKFITVFFLIQQDISGFAGVSGTLKKPEGPPKQKNIQQSIAEHAADVSDTLAHVLVSAAIAQRDCALYSIDDICDPSVEGMVCGDIATAALDMTGIAQNSALTASILSVAGRSLAIAATFLPDHAAHFDQLTIQFVLLAIAVHGLVKSYQRHSAESALGPATLKEGRAYSAYFGPAGLSWSQFKSITDTALDFVDYDEGEVISDKDDSEFLYWMYSGGVSIKVENQNEYEVSRDKTAPRKSDSYEPCKMGVHGDLRFSRELDSKDTSFIPKSVVTSAAGGATMARIHKATLKSMMDEDAVLKKSFEKVLFRSVHDKTMRSQAPPPRRVSVAARTA